MRPEYHPELVLPDRALMPQVPKILLIDDDDVIRDAFRFVLEDAGYRVIVAKDGSAGLHLAGRMLPDLIITDLMMPNGSGFFLSERLKSLADCPPIIMITGFGKEQQRAYAEALGVDLFLTKPITPKQLLAAVQLFLPTPEEEPTPTTGGGGSGGSSTTLKRLRQAGGTSIMTESALEDTVIGEIDFSSDTKIIKPVAAK